MADYDDIKWSNSSLPQFPEGMNIFKKIMCLLGYHKWEKRESKYEGYNNLKKRKSPLSLRDQCRRCGTLK